MYVDDDQASDFVTPNTVNVIWAVKSLISTYLNILVDRQASVLFSVCHKGTREVLLDQTMLFI